MFIDSLLRLSPGRDVVRDRIDESDELMPKTLSKKVASITEHPADREADGIDGAHISLDELAGIARQLLLDENLEVSKVRPFFWTMVETYVDRFQVFPFDAVKALFSYLEFHDYPEQEIHDLVERLNRLLKKQHGTTTGRDAGSSLDDDISQLRETLKYAAIVGERLDDEK